MDRRNLSLIGLATTAMLVACGTDLVPSGMPTDSSGPEPETTSETSTSTTTDSSSSTTDEVPDGSSSGDAPDLGVDVPDPPAPSRLILDVDGPNGHALELHEIVDGEPQPPIRLLPDAPKTVAFTITPVGPADRVVLDVEYGGGNHEIFVVDWSAGLPASVTSVGTASFTAAVTWVESIDAVVIRTDNTFARVDLGGSLEPVELLADLPFGIVFDQGSFEVMPVGPVLAVSGAFVSEEIYVGDIVDPSVPTLQATDFGEAAYYPRDPTQSASGHLIFGVGGYDELPREIYVLPRTGDAWGEILEVVSPADPPADRIMTAVQPQHDAFTYEVALSSDPEHVALMLGGIGDAKLDAPIELRSGYTAQHEFSADGRRLLYSTGAPDALEVIDFDDDGPSAPRHVYGMHGPAVTSVWVDAVTPDGELAFATQYDAEPYFTARAMIRVGLDPGGSVDTLLGDHDSEERLSNRVVFPHGLGVAATSTSPNGYVTYVVDCSGAVPGPPMLADQGDAPMISTLVPSIDGEWLTIAGDSGGLLQTVRVLRRTDPTAAILVVDGVRRLPVWLP